MSTAINLISRSVAVESQPHRTVEGSVQVDEETDRRVRPQHLASRLSRAVARHIPTRPLRMRNRRPLVSFTFDDVPDSALANGAPILERHAARGTFYIAAGQCGREEPHWRIISREGVAELHRRGHEIGCHTLRHSSVQLLTARELDDEIACSRRQLTEICGAPPGESFAYPFGVVSWARKLQLQRAFASCRGTYEDINRKYADLGQLSAVGLYDHRLDDARLGRLMDDTVASNGWLIFLTHDVTDSPSWVGSTPGLLHRALQAAEARGVACVTIAAGLNEIRG